MYRESSYRVNEMAWSEKVYRVVSAKSGEMGARFGLEGWPEKVVHRDLQKVPGKLSSRTGPQAPTSLLMLLCLYVSTTSPTADSSACHSLMSSLSSGRSGGLGDPLTSQSIHSTSHPLGHLSSRKAGIVRPRSGLLQKPHRKAAEKVISLSSCGG